MPGQSGRASLTTLRRRSASVAGLCYIPPALDDPLPGRRKGLRSPSLAALLSFVWPGLGQAYLGHRRAALTLAVPAVLVVGAVLWELRRGATVFAAEFLSANVALVALLLILLTAALRLVAVAHAFATGRAGRSRTSAGEYGALSVLLAAVLAMHAAGGYYVWSVYDFDRNVFTDTGQQPGVSLSPSATAGGYSGPQATPMPAVTTPAPNSTRVTILLTGVDSAPSRSEHLNDTLMVISIDTAKKTVAIISVPRDTSGFPYYFGGRAPATMKINSLITYTKMGRVKSPDDPTTTLEKEIGYLVGVPVNYYATIDLEGFAGLITKVGGVDVVNPKAIQDPIYDWLDGSKPGFYLSAGPHHLNGRLALAYVRSREGAGDNDYTRSSRQQEVIVALEKRLTKPQNVANLPNVLKAASGVVRTNFPSGQIADMVDFAQGLPPDAISKYVLGPPYSKSNATPDSGTWTSCLYLNKVATLSVQLFGTDSRYYGQTLGPGC